jgi:TPR repeat protein
MASLTRGRATHAGLAIALLLAASALQALPETSGTPATQNTLDAVKVTGQRPSGPQSGTVNPATSKVMSRRFASSCRFMNPDNPDAPDDPVTLEYLSHFGMLDHPSSYLGSFDDMRPFDSPGEALLPPGSGPGATGDLTGAPITCILEASGRNWMARKDKSLTQAFKAYESGNYAEARSRFEENWQKLGYEESALMLGRLHLLGQGTPADTPQAIKWLREVVETRFHPVDDRLRYDPSKPDQTNARIDAALLLARIHLMGVGTPRDPAKALTLWRKALDFGYEPAGTFIGQAYVTGLGTAPDGPRAIAMLTASATAGHVPAMVLLGRLYQHGMPRQPAGIPLDLEKAGAYYGAAARAGSVEATYAAARMLDLGEGTPKAPDKALALYKEAAVKGHAQAQNALATFFYQGELVPQNLATARGLFQAAAQRQHPDAMFNLAVMLAQGQGGDKDMAAAYAWCSLAKAHGHQQAAAALPVIESKLSPEDKARADALLKPAPKKS